MITPDIIAIPDESAPGEMGLSIDAMDDPRICLDVRGPVEFALSRSPPRYLPSSLTFLLSFLLLREKKDLLAEDCLDLLSPVDMIAMWSTRFRGLQCKGCSLLGPGISCDALSSKGCGCCHRCISFAFVSSCFVDSWKGVKSTFGWRFQTSAWSTMLA